MPEKEEGKRGSNPLYHRASSDYRVARPLCAGLSLTSRERQGGQGVHAVHRPDGTLSSIPRPPLTDKCSPSCSLSFPATLVPKSPSPSLISDELEEAELAVVVIIVDPAATSLHSSRQDVEELRHRRLRRPRLSVGARTAYYLDIARSSLPWQPHLVDERDASGHLESSSGRPCNGSELLFDSPPPPLESIP